MTDRDVVIDQTMQRIEIRLTGVIDGQSLNWGIVQIEQACQDGDYRQIIWDLRCADLSQLSFDTIRGTVEDWPTKALLPGARIAVVAGSEADRILLQLWREAGRHHDTRLRDVFTNMGKARAWVSETIG